MKKHFFRFLVTLIMITALCFSSALAADARYVAGKTDNIETTVGESITFSRSDYRFYPDGATVEGKSIDSSAFFLTVGTSAEFEKDVFYEWVSQDTVRLRFATPGVYTACIWIVRSKDNAGLLTSDNFSIIVHDRDGNIPELHPRLEIDPIPDQTLGSAVKINWLDYDVLYPLQKTEVTLIKDGAVLDTWNYDIDNQHDTFTAEEAGTYVVRIVSVDANGSEVSDETEVNVKDVWTGITAVNSLKVYSEPNGRKEVVTLRKGREVTVLGEEDGWYHISVDISGKIKEGYVKKDQIQ